jgi:hypothetical protein
MPDKILHSRVERTTHAVVLVCIFCVVCAGGPFLRGKPLNTKQVGEAPGLQEKAIVKRLRSLRALPDATGNGTRKFVN